MVCSRMTKAALAELDEILGFIREGSPTGARNVKARMRRAFDHIANHPKAALCPPTRLGSGTLSSPLLREKRRRIEVLVTEARPPAMGLPEP